MSGLEKLRGFGFGRGGLDEEGPSCSHSACNGDETRLEQMETQGGD